MGSNNRQLSESHILEFVEAFNKFDETQSGLVSTKQLGNLLRHLGINPTKEELQVKGGIKIRTVTIDCVSGGGRFVKKTS